MNEPRKRNQIAIVGGGMLGMTLALRLQALGHQITLFEAAARLGGLTSPWRSGEIAWDRFYHVILESDQRLAALLSELGLSDQLRWGITRTGFYTDGALHSMSNALEFLRFPPLGLVDKLRLAATIAYAGRLSSGARLSTVSVESWLRRLSGSRTYDRIWAPLLAAKLGESRRDVSARFIWATISRMYAARRSGLKTERFGYIDGGYRTIIDRFETVLRAHKVHIRCGTSVKQVTKSADGVQVDGQAFDQVVLTLPCPVVTRICPQLSAETRGRLLGVRYLGVRCVSMLLDRPLGGYYVTNVTDSSPFTGIIEMTALVDPAQFNGRSLVYLPRYLSTAHPAWSEAPDVWRAQAVRALSAMYPDFQPEQIIAWREAQAKYVMALPTLGYSRTGAPRIRTGLPGIYLINSAQIIDGTLNVDETVGLANRGALAINAL